MDCCATSGIANTMNASKTALSHTTYSNHDHNIKIVTSEKMDKRKDEVYIEVLSNNGCKVHKNLIKMTDILKIEKKR